MGVLAFFGGVVVGIIAVLGVIAVIGGWWISRDGGER
jgi:hypothetical protein